MKIKLKGCFNIRWKKQNASEAGSITLFFAVVILPIIFFLFAISVDVARYFVDSNATQKNLDDAVLYAYKYLPYTDAAKTALESYLKNKGESLEDLDITITPELVEIKSMKKVSFPFASYFGFEEGIPLGVVSRAIGVPFDSVLFLDFSYYMGPDLPLGATWDDGSVPAQFFQNTYRGRYLDENNQPQEIDPLLLTQQCFNKSALIPLKLAAISLYEYLAGISRNSVGVLAYPGSGSYFEQIRKVSAPLASGEPSDVNFSNYIDLYLGSSHCAAAAEREVATVEYQFPIISSAVGGLWRPPANNSCPAYMVDASDWTFDLNYQPCLSVEQAIWYQPVREDVNSFMPSFVAVIDEVRTQLFAADIRSERGVLAGKAVKTAVILAGDLPHESINGTDKIFPDIDVKTAISAKLNQLKQDVVNYGFQFRLYYLVAPHIGNSSSIGNIGELESFFAEEEKINGEINDNFRLKVVYANDYNLLQSKTTAILGLDKRLTLLAK